MESRSLSTPPPVVLKFGGTSVSSAASWGTILREVRARRGEGLRPVLVCSALSGVTDLLARIAAEASRVAAPGSAGWAGAAVPSAAAHPPELAAWLRELRERHLGLAADLGLDGVTLLDADLAAAERIGLGISLLGDAGPAVQARLLAHGEILSTRIGAGFLTRAGVDAAWVDAREILIAEDEPVASEARRHLAATLRDDPDPDLAARLAALRAEVVVTQGFIAGDGRGGTVLLGRGGSDTSAAVLAARLGAARCEIWTDVPGVFSAHPRLVPGARLLRELDYDEAQEVASQGAKVLHPRSIAPCRRHAIPILIRWTQHPSAEGTRIAASRGDGEARVKAISHKSGVTLVSMETNGMWQQVGFLADVFACFKAHGLSVDLVSTSEMNVSVTLDPNGNALSPACIRALVTDLERLCKVEIISPCAAVSLVGRSIRAILHRIGPVLGVFEERRIHLVSQAASDLNLTFVVDEEEAERLVRALHAHLFGSAGPDAGLLGPTWEDLQTELTGSAEPGAARATWWHRRREDLLAVARKGTPLYAYDPESIREAASSLRALVSVDRIYYAVKANAFEPVLRILVACGVGFECVSRGELEAIRALFPDLPAERILFTPNFAPRDEVAFALEAGVTVTVDSLHPLEHWRDLFGGREILLRIDPGSGRGHHDHVRTAGVRSKFGIAAGDLDEARALAARAGARVVGLHAHVGSGILAPEAWGDLVSQIGALAGEFPEARILDLGGGFGVPDRPGVPPLDLAHVEDRIARAKSAHPGLEIWIEPGRYLVAEAGVLLARVTQIKRKNGVTFIGTDAGMNSLIRPALYGAHHEIVNLSRFDAPRTVTAQIVGPICESGDVMGRDRSLPVSKEGDVVLFATAGAYGAVMASSYNLRRPAEEWMLSPGAG